MKFFRSSSFTSTLAIFLSFAVCAFFLGDLNKWSIALTIVIGSYIIGRALRKRMRGAYTGKTVIATRELYIYLAGVIAIGLGMGFRRVDMGLGLILIGTLQACFNLGRGHTNAYIPSNRGNSLL